MNKVLMVFTALFISTVAYAHDPSEHAKESTGPDCAAFEHMKDGSRKAEDPVMQAMMQKCQSHSKDEEHAHRHNDESTAHHSDHGQSGDDSMNHRH